MSRPGGTFSLTGTEAGKAAQPAVSGIAAALQSLAEHGSYTNTAGTLTGSMTTTDDVGKMTFTFTNYAASGYTLNGTLSMTYIAAVSTLSGTIQGTLALSGGTVTSLGYNVKYGGTYYSSLTLAGTVSCDGASFDVSKLGLVMSAY